MARSDAQKWYDQNVNDPAREYITPQDAQYSIAQIYADMGDVVQIGNGVNGLDRHLYTPDGFYGDVDLTTFVGTSPPGWIDRGVLPDQEIPDGSTSYEPLGSVAVHESESDPHAGYQKESEKGQPNGYAGLDASGQVPTAQLPPLAINETFTASSQVQMLALPAQTGDMCIRTDTGKTMVLAAEPASTPENWKEVLAAGQVASVNAKTGVVFLVASDIPSFATGTVAATNVQAAIAELALEKADVSALPSMSGSVPTADDASVGSAGVAANVARGDHKHQVLVGNPTGLGVANAQGSAISLARSDHVHMRPTALEIGAATTSHTHAAGDLPAGMATDAEVSAAFTAHTGAADPHPGYLTQPEGDARYALIGATVVAEIDDLTDVTAPTPADGEVLTWDAGTSQWVAAPSAGVATPGVVSGGIVTHVGGYVIHTFTGNGSLIVTDSPVTVEYFVLAGGGGASGGKSGQWYGAGAAAGTLLVGSTTLPKGTHAVTVGAGGSPVAVDGGMPGSGGSSSIAALVIALGGGGASSDSQVGGSNAMYTGFSGATGLVSGGGAGSGGSSSGGPGPGLTSSFSGTPVIYGVGGGSSSGTGNAPVSNSGDGGDGTNGGFGRAGSSGLVMVRYADPDVVNLDDLTNVTVPAPSDDDVLTWDAGTSQWVAAPPPVGAVTSVNTKTGAVSLVASDIPSSVTGSVSATTVQGAIAELATEKADVSALPAASSTAPAAVDASAGAVGVGTTFARADHRHQVSVGTPGALGGANAAGSASSLARSDHVHIYPTAANVGAAPTSHAHAAGDLPASMATDAEVTAAITAHEALSDPHAVYQKESEKGVANGYASLDAGGQIPTSQLPPLAINDTFTANSQAEMLALTAQPGDMAIRTDNGRTYVLAASPASTLSNWKEVMAAGQVTSVNSQTGAVSLTATDIPSSTTGSVSATTVQAAIAELATEKADVTSVPTASSATPAAADAAAGAPGVGTTFSRTDHKHQITVGTPVALGGANAAGSSASLARADHVHIRPTAGEVGAASASHTHAIADLPTTAAAPNAVSAAAGAGGSSTNLSKQDHIHRVDTGSPVALGAVLADGVSNQIARADHVHIYPTAANVGAAPAAHVHIAGDLPAGMATDAEVAAAVTAHEGSADPHAAYLKPAEVLAGANITVDTTTTPGSVIIAAAASAEAPPTYPVVLTSDQHTPMAFNGLEVGDLLYVHVSVTSGGRVATLELTGAAPTFTVVTDSNDYTNPEYSIGTLVAEIGPANTGAFTVRGYTSSIQAHQVLAYVVRPSGSADPVIPGAVSRWTGTDSAVLPATTVNAVGSLVMLHVWRLGAAAHSDPAGWTLLQDYFNVKIYVKVADALTVPGPTITYAGAGAGIVVQMTADLTAGGPPAALGIPTFMQDTQPTAGELAGATKYVWHQTVAGSVTTTWYESGA